MTQLNDQPIAIGQKIHSPEDSARPESGEIKSLRDSIFASLKQGILTGGLEPGHQLRLRDIAKQHSASMMPVREAIVALEAVGLVKQIPYRGAFVSRLTGERLRDFYKTRLVIEPGAIEISTPLLTAASFTTLRHLLNEIDKKSSKDNWPLVIDLDERFLMTIYRAAGSASLVEIIQTLWNRVTPYKHHLVMAQPAAAYEIVRYNRQLLAALESRDARVATQVLKESLREAMQKLSEALPA